MSKDIRRDISRRCVRCGSYSAGKPMCDECAEEIMKDAGARRRRMSFVFTLILILAIVAYYNLL